MSTEKKVVLFIVEGQSDRESLEAAVSQIIDNDITRFYVVRGDITTRGNVSPGTCRGKIGECVGEFLNRHRFKKGDLREIVHLVDTDGCYIDSSLVITGTSPETRYRIDRIETIDRTAIIRRNSQKSSVLDMLSTTKTLFGSPYRVFFFSCNLEHVLHGELRSMSDKEKETLSRAFDDRYHDDPVGFRDFMRSECFRVYGDYSETWRYIKRGSNSLNRYSNFRLFLDERLPMD